MDDSQFDEEVSASGEEPQSRSNLRQRLIYSPGYVRSAIVSGQGGQRGEQRAEEEL